MKHLFFVMMLFFLTSTQAKAQQFTQTIKGVITDKVSEKPLSGATITVIGTSIGAQTNSEGRYNLLNVPVGRVLLAVTYVGYKDIAIPEVLVTVGKEVIIDVSMDQNVKQENAIVVKSTKVKKGAASNEYATASARSFNVDEVTRFAGGRNDPSKLVSNFAGVIANNDNRNDIVVRGNSPAGVLWRIEGIPSPSPNHYSTLGTTGGPVSALNTNALKTSDFYTGAFPAEFGNATAAVFDIQLRTGNADKHERTMQLNLFSGLEAMLEGPLSKNKNGASYLVGYRYSFAAIGGTLGLNVGTAAIPKYQDWVYNIQLPKGKAGKLNLFGMGGISSIDFIGKEIDSTDFFARQDQDAYAKNGFSTFGAKHTIDLGKKTYLRTVATYSLTRNDYDAFQFEKPLNYNKKWQITDVRDRTKTFRVNSFINSKTSSQLNWRVGVTGEFYNLSTKVLDKDGQPEAAPFIELRSYNDNFNLLQAFAQGKYAVNNNLSFTAGVHGMYFSLNKKSIIEPRAAVTYKFNNNNSLYLSYGLHGQLQPFPVYLFERNALSPIIDKTNRDLDFTKAHHYVMGYEARIKTDWRIKTELYYQSLNSVPVEQNPSGFSMLNAGTDFIFPDKTGLRNNGTGTNKGIELTIEKFLSKGYYLLTSVSIFDSKYKGSDKIERNAAFNYGQVFNVLAGKEWKMGKNKKNAFTLDMRLSSIGGKYTTPVNLAASLATGIEVLDEAKYNADRLSGYFRFDTKFGFRVNSKKKRISHSFYLDLQNVTNQENIFLRRFNAQKGDIGNLNQIGFFPDILYRLQF
jgi:hypothetical protein